MTSAATEQKLPPVQYTFTNGKREDTGDWHVLRVLRLEEKLSAPYECELEIVLPVEREKEAPTEPFLGDSCVLTITRAEPAKVSRRLCGIVSQVTYLGIIHDRHVVRLLIVPALWALEQRVNTRVFQEMTVPQIARDVMKRGLAPFPNRRLELNDLQRRDYQRREYCVQYRETDLAFVTRLLFEEGIAFWFDHSGAAEMVVFEDANEPYQLCPTIGGKPVPMMHMSTSLEVINKLDCRQAMRSTRVTVRDFDWTQPSVDLTSRSPAANDDAKDYREIYESSPVIAVSEYDGTKFGKEHTQTQADILMQMDAAKATVASGSSNVCALMPGTVLDIYGHAKPSLNGKYLITEANHAGAADDSALFSDTGHAASVDYQNEFTCIPISVVYRPERPAPRPKIQGPLTATVVGDEGEEVHVDNHGRIKVQFHWDRAGTRDARSSVWIRVAQAWAGAGFGTMFIPRIGMEVVVSFIDGDLDRPLITGCVYNGMNPPPYILPDEKTKSYIHTRSSPDGRGRNELCFEDAKDGEQIYVHAQKDMDTEVKHDQTLAVDNDRTKHIKGNQKETVDKDEETLVKGHRTETIGEPSAMTSETQTVHGTRELTIDQDDTVEIGGTKRVHIKGDEERTIDGSYNLKVLAPNSYNVQIAGAFVEEVVGAAVKSFLSPVEEKCEALSKSFFFGNKISLFAGNKVHVHAGTQIASDIGLKGSRSHSASIAVAKKVTARAKELWEASVEHRHGGCSKLRLDPNVIFIGSPDDKTHVRIHERGHLFLKSKSKIWAKAEGNLELDGYNVKVESKDVISLDAKKIAMKAKSVEINGLECL